MLYYYNEKVIQDTINQNQNYVLTIGGHVVEICKDTNFEFLKRDDIENIKKGTIYHSWVIYGPNEFKQDIIYEYKEKPLNLQGTGIVTVLNKKSTFEYRHGFFG